MEVLFLSHCVPNPPDKGEKIRAYHEVRALARAHRVHVVCFARNAREMEQALELRSWCASVHVELVRGLFALSQGAAAFAVGSSLNFGYYRSAGMRRHIEDLANRVKLDCAVVYSAVMSSFVPAGLPYVLDLVDVDSEKWLTFAKSRFPGWFFSTEARRLRAREVEYAKRAGMTVLATPNERDIFRAIAGPGVAIEALENGVDTGYYNPEAVAPDPALAGRRYLVFTGAFNSFANVDGAVWFVNEVFPAMRQAAPGLELFLVGMNPSPTVMRLANEPGITVTGYVADTRPYLHGAAAVIAPLRVARGIQNKVLEGLAMDKPVLVSAEVGLTFGGEVPPGVAVCENAGDYVRAFAAAPVDGIRKSVSERYSWDQSLRDLAAYVEAPSCVA